jgi:hypothetical protein
MIPLKKCGGFEILLSKPPLGINSVSLRILSFSAETMVSFY